MLDPEKLVGDVATLVSLPEVVVRINELVDDPKVPRTTSAGSCRRTRR